MKLREITAKSILTKTGIPGVDWCLNPYVGCEHACRYCYATYMKKYSGHAEPWGEFVDAKINAPDLLKRALRRRPQGEVFVSSVTDAYQPVEARLRLTWACLELLAASDLEVSILTKSSLVARDADIFKRMKAIDVGLTITTDREEMRRLFEPRSSSVSSRIETLAALKRNGIPTYVFIGPMLPMHPETLVGLIAPYADKVLIDRMNYQWKVASIYTRAGLRHALDPDYFEETEGVLVGELSRLGVETVVV